MNFDSLKLIAPILRAVKAQGYEKPTPIQVQGIPPVLARKDVLACAQTGTGKTAAFALPILQLLSEPRPRSQGGAHGNPGSREIRALILTPTRELASQIAQNFSDYGSELPLRTAVIFGGVSQSGQVRAIRQGIDILIATPGRLLDLMHQRLVQFKGLEIFVLDEADRMLDMGFITDVRRVIAAIPQRRQTLFFSATMPPEIQKLSGQILTNPVRIEVTPVASTAEKIEQAVYFVDKKQKTALLLKLLENPEVTRGLVFTRTKHEANRVCDSLEAAGIGACAIHGNKSQGAREKALERIKTGEARILVATDIAARGIDIDNLSHVFNHDIPNVPESYVHRIGRTARAGNTGHAASFCSKDERTNLAGIERLIRKRIPVLPTPEALPNVPKAKARHSEQPYRDPRARSSHGHAPRPEQRNRFASGPKAQSVHGYAVRTGSNALPAKPKTASPSASLPVKHSGVQVVVRPVGGINPPPSPNNRRNRRKQKNAAGPGANGNHHRPVHSEK